MGYAGQPSGHSVHLSAALAQHLWEAVGRVWLEPVEALSPGKDADIISFQHFAFYCSMLCQELLIKSMFKCECQSYTVKHTGNT